MIIFFVSPAREVHVAASYPNYDSDDDDSIPDNDIDTLSAFLGASFGCDDEQLRQFQAFASHCQARSNPL